MPYGKMAANDRSDMFAEGANMGGKVLCAVDHLISSRNGICYDVGPLVAFVRPR